MEINYSILENFKLSLNEIEICLTLLTLSIYIKLIKFIKVSSTKEENLSISTRKYFSSSFAQEKKKIERKNFTIISDYFVISINFSNLFDQPRYTRREQLAWQEIRRAIKDNYSVEGSWLRMPR